MRRRKLALYHISEQLGVSTSTVSLSMRDSPPIPCATRARVKAALSAAGYVCHRRAAALRTSKTFTVGVIVDDLSRVQSGRGRNPTLIWIDPVKLALRLSKSSPSMRSIQGAAGMVHDGGSC